MHAREVELPVIEIDIKTEKIKKQRKLKRELIKLLADPEVQMHLYNAMVSESSHRKNMAESYK